MSKDILCPGCHIGCLVPDPQCGRGLKFREMWEAGEEIPERRRPMGKPGSKPPAIMNMPTEDRIMFLLAGLLPRILGRLEGPETDQILTWLQRQEGAMTAEVMPERARVNKDALEENLTALQEQGFITDEVKPWGTRYYWITDAGRQRCEQAKAERRDAIDKKFSCYTDQEKEQLLQLLEKLLQR